MTRPTADAARETEPSTEASVFAFDNSYARLPEGFHARLDPTPVAAPSVLRVNSALGRMLGVDMRALAGEGGAQILAGNRVPDGAEPLAMAYAGHQFGNYVPQLGDGRAILLGEVNGTDGVRYDIQLKGAGRTPFSRMGDGRSALGPVIREYIVSEAMHSLGVKTTRALAMVRTGERVIRQNGPEPGGILTRVANSHVRVGTFQFFHHQGDTQSVKRLADYVIARHYPDLQTADRPYHALLERVALATADLIASWLAVGFIHGVMNTDNTSMVGETIDYGPCAFMDRYHPEMVFSSIDMGGRYAYNQQPQIGQWNLARFAECLLPLMADDPEAAIPEAQEILAAYARRFEEAHTARFRDKLGLATDRDGDRELAQELLTRMAEAGADFTLTFRTLSGMGDASGDGDAALRAHFPEQAAALDDWLGRWRARLGLETRDAAARQAAMRAANPLFIPRNHWIEKAIEAAYAGDDSIIDDLMTVLADPYSEQPGLEDYAEPPRPDEVVRQTFCGT